MQPDEGHQPDYNFIMNPGQAPKRGLMGNGDKKQRILIVAAGGLLLVLAIILLLSFALGGGGNNNTRLLGLAQQQAEIVRVATLAENEVTSPEAKNMASNVELVLISSQNQTVDLLAQQGQKVKPKDLTLKQDTETDEALTIAKQANRYDETLTSILQSELSAYKQELTDLYNDSSVQAEKDVLQNLYSQVNALTPITE